MFLNDKYKPDNIDDAFFHKDILKRLKVISKDDSIPNIIFSGPPGSGKKTIMNKFMEMLYGKSVLRTYQKLYKINGSGNNTTEVYIEQSKHHIVIKPNNNNGDRYLMHNIVKQYAKSKPLDIILSQKKLFKIILIKNIDNMSNYAQFSLRRIMESYSMNCRFIMLASSLSKVKEPIKSRCLCVRIPSPPNKNLFGWVCNIITRENIPLSFSKTYDIIEKADGNLVKILWNLDRIKYNMENIKLSYDNAIDNIVKLLYSDNNIAILKIRTIIYKIMISNVNSSNIIIHLIDKLIDDKNIPSASKFDIIYASTVYETNLIKGRRKILHIEAFIQNVYQILHNNI